MPVYATAEQLEQRGHVVLELDVVVEELDEVHHDVGLLAAERVEHGVEAVADVDQRDLVAAASRERLISCISSSTVSHGSTFSVGSQSGA